jgi:hypothetical protein
MPLRVSGVSRSSSGGYEQVLFGGTAGGGGVLTACRLRFTPNSNFAEPPEDGLVTPETRRGIVHLIQATKGLEGE